MEADIANTVTSVRELIPDSPLLNLKKGKRRWIYQVSSPVPIGKPPIYKSEPISNENLLSNSHVDLHTLANVPTCINVYGDTNTCTFLHYLCDIDDGVIDTIVQGLFNHQEFSPSAQAVHQIN